MRSLFLTFLLAGSSAALCAQEVAGDWQGSLHAGGGVLRLLFHFRSAPDGALAAKFDSLDQDAPGISVSSIAFQDGRLTLASKEVDGAFEGRLSADGDTIEGTWMQGQ